MVDIVTREVRSRMMSGIRGKNTKPEMVVRKALHAAGFRYRLHDKRLPGNPDLVFPKYRAVVFVHGCFWHGHDCHLFRLPSTRSDFWCRKIAGNVERDRKAVQALENTGWRTGIIWECAVKGRTRLPIDTVLKNVEKWLSSVSSRLEVRGLV
ncbi:very short patch repair endonuclease [Hoeflea sp. YIM 152468]|nr:very short patch repair endonuclease [Hoeflea sp. YIM 152468]MDF1607802.1 very short patch repair endonuclease [Hoeflea sp. YIM 152468]